MPSSSSRPAWASMVDLVGQLSVHGAGLVALAEADELLLVDLHNGSLGGHDGLVRREREVSPLRA